ncbi:hypothetical protein [Olsenella profusa]|uniref:Uncharacterized protein n=1 Tax=Olsenella profusa TaxID=138595 RepID=A0ABS2F4P4_9ACTN|nr:hypothetical protein [Olsenella profusa]MBM6775542.1 hypothetical protein [Olsenella profusa]
MLYIGNFSYNDDSDSKDNYCLMPCVVEAADADEAMDKFATYLQKVRRSSDLLDGAHEIFLDSLTELEGVPEEPVICQWQKIVPAMNGLCSITSALPVVDEVDDTVNAYAWGDDDHDHDDYEDDLEDDFDLDELSEDELATTEAFLLF